MATCDKADSVAPAEWWNTVVIEPRTFKLMHGSLQGLVDSYGLFKSFEARLNEIHHRLVVTDDWELPLSAIPKPHELSDQERVAAVLSTMYEYLERAKGLYHVGDDETALGYVRWFETTADVVGAQVPRRHGPTERIASAGGKARSAKYNEIRDKLVALIVEKRPRQGWRSKSEVARTVSAALAQTYQAVGMAVPREIEPAIRRWLSAYPPARNAYYETQRAGRQKDSNAGES